MESIIYGRMLGKLLKLWLPMVFITAVLVTICGLVLKYSETDFRNNAVETSATIIGFTGYGYPVLSYIADGKEYIVRSRSFIPNGRIGTQLGIKYHRLAPSDIQTGDSNPLYESSIWMIVSGIAVSATTSYMMFKKRRNRGRMSYTAR